MISLWTRGGGAVSNRQQPVPGTVWWTSSWLSRNLAAKLFGVAFVGLLCCSMSGTRKCLLSRMSSTRIRTQSRKTDAELGGCDRENLGGGACLTAPQEVMAAKHTSPLVAGFRNKIK